MLKSITVSYPRSPAVVDPEHHSTPLRVSFAKDRCPFALQQAGLVQHAPMFFGSIFQHSNIPACSHVFGGRA